MRRYLFSSDFFAAFRQSARVELATEKSYEGRSHQMRRRLGFIEEHLPRSEFCSMFTRKGADDAPVRVVFYFSNEADATFFLLGASDL